MERALIFVRGRVQGVGFRWWTRIEAARLGLRGQVRNCPDGTVEVLARGEAEQLDHLFDLLERGPPPAHVTRVERHATSGIEVDGFHIDH